MAAAGKIIDLRNLLAKRFPHSPLAPSTFLPTGLDPLDRVLGGGLPKSTITELISPQVSAGSASIIHGLIHHSWAHRHFVALIDGCDSFDPQALNNNCLRHLLWVRCTNTLETIKAADLLLRDGNFGVVIVDLVLNPAAELRKLPQTTWYRLQRLVEATSTACLVLTRQNLVSSAQVKVLLENRWSLSTLKNDTAPISMRFRVRRSHLKLEITNQKSDVG